MDEIINSDVYLLSRYPKILFYNVFIFLLIFITIIFSFNYYYVDYYEGIGAVVEIDDKFLVQISIPVDKVSKITANETVEIEDKIYKYKIFKIDDNLISDGANVNYQNVYLELNLESDKKKNNLLLNFKLEIGKEKLIEIFKNLF